MLGCSEIIVYNYMLLLNYIKCITEMYYMLMR